MRRSLSTIRAHLVAIVFTAGALAGSLFVGGCTVIAADDDRLAILFYNVENLFDEYRDGTEYDEFTPEAGWDGDDVTDRLERLGNALESVEPYPDVIALVEVENRAVLDRVFDQFFIDVPYPYRVFRRNPGGATGVALVSRYPVMDVRTLQARAGATPPLRPVIEARIDLPETELVVFVNHWKSKRGGSASTEPLRRAGARLLAARLRRLHREEPHLPVALCGDFNEQPHESEIVGDAYPTALVATATLNRWLADTETAPDWFQLQEVVEDRIILAESAADARAWHQRLAAPVFIDSWAVGGGSGSYWYYDHWEQIDQVALNAAAAAGPHLSLHRFDAVRTSDVSDASGRPVSWFDDRTGVSDHLPILAEFDMDFD